MRALQERCGVEWSGVEWSGVEWSGVEWSGVEWTYVWEWLGHVSQEALGHMDCLVCGEVAQTVTEVLLDPLRQATSLVWPRKPLNNTRSQGVIDTVTELPLVTRNPSSGRSHKSTKLKTFLHPPNQYVMWTCDFYNSNLPSLSICSMFHLLRSIIVVTCGEKVNPFLH